MLRVIALLLLLFLLKFTAFVSLSQSPLLFPKNSVFQFTIGVSVPINTNKRGSISFSVGFQFNYILPSNLTQLQPTVFLPARADTLHLQDVYQSIENILEQHGWKNGRQCLLRSICELAQTPLGQTATDAVEGIIQLLLTPTEDLPEAVNSSHRSTDKLYHEAELFGTSGRDCVLNYPDCIESPLKLFTEILML